MNKLIRLIKTFFALTRDGAYVEAIQKKFNVSTLVYEGQWEFTCNECSEIWNFNPGEMKWGYFMIKTHFPHTEAA